MKKLICISFFFARWITSIIGLYAVFYIVRLLVFQFDIAQTINPSRPDDAFHVAFMITVVGLAVASFTEDE